MEDDLFFFGIGRGLNEYLKFFFVYSMNCSYNLSGNNVFIIVNMFTLTYPHGIIYIFVTEAKALENNIEIENCL